ncbi:MAG: chemotaxis protein CheB [Methylobacter sp.]
MTSTKKNDGLSIVCLGASAGGLETYLKILSLPPPETGLIFVIIHHQPSDWKSLLPEIIPRYTSMPVRLVEDGEIAKADHVYIGSPGMQVYMAGDSFKLAPLLKQSGCREIFLFFAFLGK